MPEPTAFDRQLERAWKGDYSTEGAWDKPQLDGETLDRAPRADGDARSRPPFGDDARGTAREENARARVEAWKRCRLEIESIVEKEIVPICEVQGRTEGTMKLAKFVKFREEKFGGVLFETRNEKVYTLNPTGAAVVREIVGGASDVVKALKDRFDDKDGRVEAEARAFLEELKTKGLVEA